MQPLIENAIEHGLAGLESAGFLDIICKHEAGTGNLIISISDNGLWKGPVNKEGGIGLSLTTERLKTVNKMDKGKRINLDFNVSSGTRAILTFHNWLF